MTIAEILRALGGGVKDGGNAILDALAPRERDVITPRTMTIPSMPIPAAGSANQSDELLPGAMGVRASDVYPDPIFAATEYAATDAPDTPLVTKGKRRPSKFVRSLPGALQAGIIAAGTPNIAGGGGTDIMRAMGAGQEWSANQDAIQRSMARQNRLDSIAGTRAESDLLRDRSRAALDEERAASMKDAAGLIHTPTGAVLKRNPVTGWYETVYAPPTVEAVATGKATATSTARLAEARKIYAMPDSTQAEIVAAHPEALNYFMTGTPLKPVVEKAPEKATMFQGNDQKRYWKIPKGDGTYDVKPVEGVGDLRPRAPNTSDARNTRAKQAREIARQFAVEGAGKGLKTAEDVARNLDPNDPRLADGMYVDVMQELKRAIVPSKFQKPTAMGEFKKQQGGGSGKKDPLGVR